MDDCPAEFPNLRFPLYVNSTLYRHPFCAQRSANGKLGFMAATPYRYLVNLPGVCQGKTIIEGTRIGAHDVIGLLINGASIDDVCRSFPDLSRAQVYECLAYYYEDHRPEIDALIAEQMSEPSR